MPQYNMCSQMRIHNAINPGGKSILSAQQTIGHYCGEHREVTAVMCMCKAAFPLYGVH